MTVGGQGPGEIVGSASVAAAPRPKDRWAFDTRLNRFSRGLAAALLTVETFLALFTIQIASIAESRNPFAAVLTAISYGPGEQVVARFDPIRAALFYLGVACVVGVLGFGAITLWRSVGPGARPFGGLGRMAVRVSVVASLIWPALLILAGLTTGTRFRVLLLAAGVAVVAMGVLFLPAVDVLFQEGVRPDGRGWLQTGALAVVLVVFVIAVQRFDVGGYSNDGLPIGRVSSSLPLANGFWRDFVVQHPASGFAADSACGDTAHCAIFGEGFGHQALQPWGEVTVTADGGRTWRSWLLPQLRNQVAPFALGSACTGSTCIAPIVTGGFAVVEIQPDGSVTDQVVDSGEFLGRNSCPTALWCAGVSNGAGANPPALVVSQGPGLARQRIALPSWLAPAGTSLSVDALDCPEEGTCVMISTRDAGPQLLTPAMRASLGIGDQSISVTDDGGLTWVAGTFPAASQEAGSTRATEAIDCPDRQTCWGLFGTGTTGASISLFRSADTGRTWQPVAGPGGLAGDGDPRITCGNATSCLLIGQRPSSGDSQAPLPAPGASDGYRTLDEGRTWQPVSLPPDPGLQWFVPTCYGTGVCIATGLLTPTDDDSSLLALGHGRPVVITSTDGAMTWQVHRLPVPRPTVPDPTDSSG